MEVKRNHDVYLKRYAGVAQTNRPSRGQLVQSRNTLTYRSKCA